MNFILGFIIGAVTEFIALLAIAHEVQEKKGKEILRGDKNVNQSMGKR